MTPPLYDFNDTTKYQINKLYDYNNTTSSKIAKVYDYNGTTNQIIYSAEEYLVGYEGNTSSSNYYNAYTSNWYGNPGLCVMAYTIDASSWDTIHLDLQGSYVWYTNPDVSYYYVNSIVRFGYSTSAVSVGSNYSSSYFTASKIHTSNNSKVNYTFDISSRTGTIYFFITHCCGGGGITVYSRLYNLWLT